MSVLYLINSVEKFCLLDERGELRFPIGKGSLCK